MIYFDSAATTFQKPRSVTAAVEDALATMSSPGRGGYGAAMRAADTAFACREELAELERDGLVYSQRTTGRFVTEDQTMINNVKRSLAKRHIQAFWEAMTRLGYDRQEVLALMRQEVSEEGENNGSSGV